jgi:Ferredoxin-like domain in Api92-like protein
VPNWCSNFAEFRHNDPAQIQRVFAAYKRGDLFKEFDPCPPELMAEIPLGDDYAARVKAQEEHNEEEYGYKSWYEWQIDNWGTKWDIAEIWDDMEAPDSDSTMIGISFDTAWSPPIEFYRSMTDGFGFTIEAHYLEEGVGFVGKYTSEDDDNCYELDDMDLDTVPKDIRDHWDLDSIMESRAEWDAEDEPEEDNLDEEQDG